MPAEGRNGPTLVAGAPVTALRPVMKVHIWERRLRGRKGPGTLRPVRKYSPWPRGA